MPETIRAPDGLYGVAVAETRISRSSPDGSLTYRGYAIKELFERATFEECAYLILEGRLPRSGELDEFEEKLRVHSKVPESVYNVVRGLPVDSDPMDLLRTAISALGAVEGSLGGRDREYSLIAKMPALAANCYRVARGMSIIEPEAGMDQVSGLLYMLTGKRPDQFESWVFERMLILYLDHDMNASAFAVRVVSSTLADVYAATTAGLAALKGPLHGGANEAAMKTLL